ncbi:phosphatidylinositol 3-kinase 2-like, partial [Drosophila innubila]|uniref:phosphatidylinositol 3-kinase 2-like n=1 Tax=Drosophila innubila TaxID=198719 RepID=UPI00148DA440
SSTKYSTQQSLGTRDDGHSHLHLREVGFAAKDVASIAAASLEVKPTCQAEELLIARNRLAGSHNTVLRGNDAGISFAALDFRFIRKATQMNANQPLSLEPKVAAVNVAAVSVAVADANSTATSSKSLTPSSVEAKQNGQHIHEDQQRSINGHSNLTIIKTPLNKTLLKKCNNNNNSNNSNGNLPHVALNNNNSGSGSSSSSSGTNAGSGSGSNVVVVAKVDAGADVDGDADDASSFGCDSGFQSGNNNEKEQFMNDNHHHHHHYHHHYH